MSLTVHDFFEDQPVKDAAVFLMRMIMHDWPDTYCEIILKKLRQSARRDTQLLIIDNILSYACQETNSELKKVPGNDTLMPPAPLLPNAGHASAFGYMCDVQVSCTVYQYMMSTHRCSDTHR